MILTEAMNTYNPALSYIVNKGYEISLILSDDGEEIERWQAEKETNKILAFNPLSLMALVVIAEEYQDNWKESFKEDLYDSILDKYT